MIAINTKPKQAVMRHEAILSLNDPWGKKPNPCQDEPAFSEDICIIDENGVNGIAFFSFEENKWVFYIDTLIDYNTEGAGTKWKWYYPPISNNDIEW